MDFLSWFFFVSFFYLFFFPVRGEKNHDSNINMNRAQNMSYRAVAQAVLDAVVLLVSLHWRLCAAFSGYNFSPSEPFSKSFCTDHSFVCSQSKLSWMSLLWPSPVLGHGGRGDILPCFALSHCCWPGQWFGLMDLLPGSFLPAVLGI